VERNVLLSMPAERLLQLFLAHLRQHDVLHDHGVTTDAGSNSSGANLVFVEDVRDHVGDVVKLHDLAIDDGVSLKVFESQVEKLQRISLSADLNSFARTRADVETNEVL